MELNINYCEARKSMKGDGYLQQCTHRKKNDSPYCGKHQNCTDPYSNYLKAKQLQSKKSKLRY